MKKISMFLLAVAMVVFAICTSQAALLVEYNFEGSGAATAGFPITSAATVVVGNYSGEGKIGTSSASLTSTNGSAIIVNAPYGNDAWPADSDNNFWSGSMSFWVKGAAENASGNLFCSRNTGTGAINMGLYTNQTDGSLMTFYGPGHPFGPATTSTSPALMNNAWHLVTATWTQSTGASGTGSAAYYVDGACYLNATGLGTLTSASPNGSTTGTVLLGADSDSGTGIKPNASQLAMFDDYAAWNNVLTATEVKALYNLGNDPVLNFGAKEAQYLFDLFLAGSGTAVVSGGTWMPASGLPGAAGDVGIAPGVWNYHYVTLDANGSGVIGFVGYTPEPSTIVLLGNGAIGLLVYAWRRGRAI